MDDLTDAQRRAISERLAARVALFELPTMTEVERLRAQVAALQAERDALRADLQTQRRCIVDLMQQLGARVSGDAARQGPATSTEPMSACPHGVPHRWACEQCDQPSKGGADAHHT